MIFVKKKAKSSSQDDRSKSLFLDSIKSLCYSDVLDFPSYYGEVWEKISEKEVVTEPNLLYTHFFISTQPVLNFSGGEIQC